MTKIKLDIESDDSIISAKILLKHADGTTSIEDVQTETEESTLSKMAKKITVKEAGIDDAFKETY